jgi:hypothetical protein
MVKYKGQSTRESTKPVKWGSPIEARQGSTQLAK